MNKLRGWLGKQNKVPSVTVLIWVLVSLLVSVAGPFGTYDVAMLPLRILYWGIVIGCMLFLSIRIRTFLATRLADRQVWLLDLAAATMLALICAPPLHAFTRLMFPEAQERLPSSFDLVLYVAFVTAGAYLFRNLLINAHRDAGARAPVAAPETTPTPQKRAVPLLQRRLPESETGEITHLTVEDHFVIIATTNGTHRVRMRFGDAVREMEGVEGYSTHRSHWVAKWAIKTCENQAGRKSVIMKCGRRVPISRKYSPGLESAGLM